MINSVIEVAVLHASLSPIQPTLHSFPRTIGRIRQRTKKEFLRLILGCEFWYIPRGLRNPVDAKNGLPPITNSDLRVKTEHR